MTNQGPLRTERQERCGGGGVPIRAQTETETQVPELNISRKTKGLRNVPAGRCGKRQTSAHTFALLRSFRNAGRVFNIINNDERTESIALAQATSEKKEKK